MNYRETSLAVPDPLLFPFKKWIHELFFKEIGKFSNKAHVSKLKIRLVPARS